jgi:hypothetical protein
MENGVILKPYCHKWSPTEQTGLKIKELHNNNPDISVLRLVFFTTECKFSILK